MYFIDNITVLVNAGNAGNAGPAEARCRMSTIFEPKAFPSPL
jgi:hypothetical protein